ncbi:glycosyltransferase [Flammeovirga sp. SubArs3]|uniref:glycosyltransferase n=1 Tax=Flammeovirga sp. SubArs3 TaxID=2995316 RepID=UPI00248CD611|nr:glycosyltransferase [Flammeovirga sp. SubArs3]
MKVLHINTYPHGGAAYAAIRMSKALQDLGVDSKVLVRDEFKQDGIVSSGKSVFFRKITKLWQKWKAFPYIKEEKDIETFSSPFSLYPIHHHPEVAKADIIVLHWVSLFLDIPSFFKEVNKPIVIYMHDMNYFKGGYHYAEDEVYFPHLHHLDMRYKAAKKKAYDDSKSMITVTAPSQWLVDLSKKSDLLGQFEHHHIRNVIDSDTFDIISREEARRELGIPNDKKILLFVSESIKNRRKGGQILLDAIKNIKNIDDVNVVIIGEVDNDLFKSENFYKLGRIYDPQKMCLAYNSADLYIMPSREDNLPNVILESHSCGTPVMAFSIGGITEMVNNENGYLLGSPSSDTLQKGIEDWMKVPIEFDRMKIRSNVLKEFNTKETAKRFFTLLEHKLQQ